jgi:hypothetical protein
MDFEELVLRFFALVEDLEEYKPPLRQFLNQYMRVHRAAPPDPSLVQLLQETCAAVSFALGANPFRVTGARNLNKALFDAVMVTVAKCDRQHLIRNGKALSGTLEEALNDDEFLTAIGRATADRHRMLYRIGLVADRLRRAGITVDLPVGFGVPEKKQRVP